VFEISLRPEFQGRIFVLENYNLAMTRELLPGVDVWLNTPEYPLEACGTSGMKAAINGAVNLSVLDGWWAEAYDGENGWAITPHPELEQGARDRQEAEELLNILEYQVIPRYYSRNKDGEPEAWIGLAKTSMKTVLPNFNTIRMAMDYLRGSYSPAAREGRRLREDAASGAKELAQWKKKIADIWPRVQCRLATPMMTAINSGEPLSVEVIVNLNGLDADDVVVECLLGGETEWGEFTANYIVPFELVSQDSGGEAVYHCDLFEETETCSAGGLQHFKIRAYPFHPLLSHPLECGRMRWL
jgi:starch phosphorylase